MYRKGLQCMDQYIGLIVRFTAHHAYFAFSVLILKLIVKK
jgi:hypothetical protein